MIILKVKLENKIKEQQINLNSNMIILKVGGVYGKNFTRII